VAARVVEANERRRMTFIVASWIASWK
jgi:hypothetical protein